MLSPGQILCAVVLLIGVPSAWRNPTAAALVGAWAVTKAIYLMTGNGLATEFYVFPDIAVIAIIFCKPEYRPSPDYVSIWHQLKCIVTERSPADRIVMLIYPIEWMLYVSTLNDYYVWWSLWGLSIVQFLAAGSETLFHIFHRRHAEAANHPSDYPGSLLVALPAGGRLVR
jgi:hypothetical protein